MAARWLLILAGTLAAAAGAAAIVGQTTSGAQPWSAELSDNFVFAKSIAFAIGLGVVVGIFRGGAFARRTTRRQADGAIRRFLPGTVIGHWIMTVGVLLALPTGLWGYLGGIMDVEAPIPLYLFYRVHYIGGALILYATASFLTYWWLTGDRSLLVRRGQWRRHLLGLTHELPRAIATRLASALRVDMTQPAPPTERFTYYEKVVSFPTWAFAIALITITGLIKALRYIVPVPGPILFWASTLHVAAMVLILLKVLDHLRDTFERWPLMVAMATTWVRAGYARRAVGALGLLWAAANVVVGFVFVVNAFVAKTAAKEGLPAQAALLFGGLLIGGLAVLLARQSFRLIVSPDGAAG